MQESLLISTQLVAANMNIRRQDSSSLLTTAFSKKTRALLTPKQYSKGNPRNTEEMKS